MKRIIGIACLANNRAIGYNNNLIYNLKNDMNFFKNITKNTVETKKRNALIMGKNTAISISRILPGRLNCVITSQVGNYASECKYTNSNLKFYNNINTCLHNLKNDQSIENIFVIGGSQIYKYFMDNELYDELYISYLKYPKIRFGDSFFPYIDYSKYNNISLVNNKLLVSKGILHNYSIYNIKKNPSLGKSNLKNTNNVFFNDFIKITSTNRDELQYLSLLNNVYCNGDKRKSRNATTYSLFSQKMEFDISKSFPLITTKKVFFKGVAKELIWFLNGKSNSKELEKDGVNIWKGNSSREYLDSKGLNNYDEGECGPIYGVQWRNFNGEGYDQIKKVIELIKTDPYSRRIFMTAWNPNQLDKMALPPCHVSYHFYVRDVKGKKYLDCAMYQRSGDLFLGVPFNIASTSLLVYIISNITGVFPGKMNIMIGDAHIYNNHMLQVKEQLTRIPLKFPYLKIKNKLNCIEDLKYEDIELINYSSHPAIKADMVA